MASSGCIGGMYSSSARLEVTGGEYTHSFLYDRLDDIVERVLFIVPKIIITQPDALNKVLQMTATVDSDALTAYSIDNYLVNGNDTPCTAVNVTDGEVEVKKLPLFFINYEIHAGISFEGSEVGKGCRVIIPELFESLTFHVTDDGITNNGDCERAVVFASLVVIHTLYAVPHFAIG